MLKSIAEQGKLTPALQSVTEAAPTKQQLEDLDLPYEGKRRTKGLIAREAGLEPLADPLFADPMLDPHTKTMAFSPVTSVARPSWPKPALPTRLRCWTACATCLTSAGSRSVAGVTCEQEVKVPT